MVLYHMYNSSCRYVCTSVYETPWTPRMGVQLSSDYENEASWYLQFSMDFAGFTWKDVPGYFRG